MVSDGWNHDKHTVTLRFIHATKFPPDAHRDGSGALLPDIAEIADLLPCPEDMDLFYYLADRKALLFPEEERVICKVETGPALYSDIAFQVASAM